MALDIHINTSETDAEFGTSGVEFVEFSSGNDRILFTAGSAAVADGETVPTEHELISAGIIITGSEIIVDTYLLEDVSEDELIDIPLMGNQNTRYVLAFDFDVATAGEPVLEIWDDDTFDTAESTILGGGTPSQSFIRGVTTTAGAPGTDWTGTPMAGAGAGNFLFLNNQAGALASPDTLYANIKCIIPASQTNGFSANPVFVCKYLSNS